jgi:uncharacterized membrane protein
VLLFGSFLAWAVVMRISMKRRQRAGELVLPAFRSSSYDLLAVVIGLVVLRPVHLEIARIANRRCADCHGLNRSNRG